MSLTQKDSFLLRTFETTGVASRCFNSSCLSNVAKSKFYPARGIPLLQLSQVYISVFVFFLIFFYHISEAIAQLHILPDIVL